MEDQVVCADNLEVLKELPDDHIRLIYTDPPFGTGKRQVMRRTRSTLDNDGRIGFAGRRYQTEHVSTMAYDDTMNLDDYLDFLWVRLEHMHRVLTPDGSLYLHLDHRAAPYARLMLDELFGHDRS